MFVVHVSLNFSPKKSNIFGNVGLKHKKQSDMIQKYYLYMYSEIVQYYSYKRMMMFFHYVHVY